MHCAMLVLVTLCLAFSGADIEFHSRPNNKFYYNTFMRLRDTLF